jgi:hypothetical protein
VAGDVALVAHEVLGVGRLVVDRERDVDGHALRQRGAAGEVEHVVDVLGAHDALVVGGEVREQVVGVEVLQVAGADEVVVGHPGHGQQRHALQAGVEQAVGEVDGAGPGRGEADAEPARHARVADGRHGADLLVADVHVAEAVVPRPQRLHEAVDAVARQAEDGVNAPVHEPVHEQVGGCVGHGCCSVVAGVQATA